jgi:hypothetical protein
LLAAPSAHFIQKFPFMFRDFQYQALGGSRRMAIDLDQLQVRHQLERAADP